jgi:cardiolipin synthase
MLIDESISLFGTVNMDMRSFYLNLELSLLIYERQVNADLDAVIDRYARGCSTLTRETWAARSWRRRFLENLFRLAGPLL